MKINKSHLLTIRALHLTQNVLNKSETPDQLRQAFAICPWPVLIGFPSTTVIFCMSQWPTFSYVSAQEENQDPYPTRYRFFSKHIGYRAQTTQQIFTFYFLTTAEWERYTVYIRPIYYIVRVRQLCPFIYQSVNPPVRPIVTRTHTLDLTQQWAGIYVKKIIKTIIVGFRILESRNLL